MKRWVALLPGQKWVTAVRETIEITGYAFDDAEGGLIFRVFSPTGEMTSTDLVTSYDYLEKFLEENEGALIT